MYFVVMEIRMRPQKLSYEMEKAFLLYFQNGTTNAFKVLLPELKRVYAKRVRQDKDYRIGQDTYGYDNIYWDMRYISDRWNCSFRLRWLIDGLEEGLI